MDIETFTHIHTGISLMALVFGIPTIAGLLGRPVTPFTVYGFLVTALATSITGFMFPFGAVTPAFVTGIIATVVLIATFYALLIARNTGAWRIVAAVGIVVSEYLLAFVFVVQAFLKIPALAVYAPGGAGPVFATVQVVVLVFFGWLGWRAVRQSRLVAAAHA
jgi:hypothetical protein